MTKVQENKLLIEFELLKLSQLGIKNCTGQHYELCTIDAAQLCISITSVRGQNMWYETYRFFDGKKTGLYKQKVWGLQLANIVEDFVSLLSEHEIKTATNILLKRKTATATKAKTDTSTMAQSSKRPTKYKRNTRGQTSPKEPLLQQTKDSTGLTRPSNQKERDQAKLERKLFSNPKMWTFSL